MTPTHGHEEWTKRILLDERPSIGCCAALSGAARTGGPVIDGQSQPGWVSRLVSGQLDVDRMDYLLRDALFTGAEYGRFQLERIINTLVLHGDEVAAQSKGMHAIEEYVLARHFMYWRVYLHKTIRGAEMLLRVRCTGRGGWAP